MRYSLFLLFFTMSSAFVFGQRISGRITDADGTAVEYVNIGIPGTTTGVISDGAGRFTLHIPDSLAGREVVFSHISYEAVTVEAAGLVGREDVEIRLPESRVALAEVVVVPGKAKYRRVGNRLAALPVKGFVVPVRRGVDETTGEEVWSGYRGEFGNVLRIRKPMFLEQVLFTIRSCTAPAMARMALYRIDETGAFTRLNHSPVYVAMNPHDRELEYAVDVSEQSIVAAPGKLLVTMNFVEFEGDDSSLCVPVYVGEAYERYWASDRFHRSSIHTGFEVYGRVMPD